MHKQEIVLALSGRSCGTQYRPDGYSRDAYNRDAYNRDAYDRDECR